MTIRVQGRQAIGEAYQDDRLAEEYLQSRYEKDGMLKAIHGAQLRILHRALRENPASRVLEIACGPARVTAELSEVRNGVALDQSDAMLRIAQRRLTEKRCDGWRIVRGDAFHLPFDTGDFDFVLTFKLLRHFDVEHRQQLLQEIGRVLRPGGVLLFDAVNAPACRWLYEKWGLTNSWIDDFHFTQNELHSELAREGFSRVNLHPVHRPILAQYAVSCRLQPRLPPRISSFVIRVLDSLGFGMPLEWVVECRRA